MLPTAAKPWYLYRDGSGRGDGPIGRPLPKANYCSVSDLPGDPNFPAAISARDYGGPGWLLAPIETAAIRDLSQIGTILSIYEGQGKGLDYYDGELWSIRDWANRLSQDWYGKSYDDLTNYDRRRQIRCAILGASRKAYLLLYVANAEDIGQLAQSGSTFRGVTSAGLAAAAAVSQNPILAIIAAIFGAVSGVVALATKDQLKSISDALLRGEEMDQTARQAFCANFEQFFAINDVIWDSARQALVSATNDPEVTANLEQINATIAQVVAQSQQGIELICGIIEGVELQPVNPAGPPLPAEGLTPSGKYPTCEAVARAAGLPNPQAWTWSPAENQCVPGQDDSNGNGKENGNFFTQKIGGVPVWAAIGIGWVLFSRAGRP